MQSVVASSDAPNGAFFCKDLPLGLRCVKRVVRAVFSGKRALVESDEEGYLSVPLTLAPGEGQLLATDAASRL
jgi:hypothetical protein